MRKCLLFVVSVVFLFCSQVSAQSFNGTGGNIPGSSTSQTCFPLTVSGVGAINASKGLAQVCINITHPNTDELEILLTAPDGTVVPLTVQNGGTGDNYSGTCFTATAAGSIKFASAPFNGTYLPEGHLGAVNNGQNADGTWRICIQDRRNGGNAGKLTSWTLNFTNTPAPAPPALAACNATLPASSSCASATAVCDFNGLCGSTQGSSVQDWNGSGLDDCFGLQNNSFIKFVAATTTASFSVWTPTSSNASYNQGGIQMLFFEGNCNSGPVTPHGCYPHIFPYSGNGKPLVTVVTSEGLVPGRTYYLMIDGFNNDQCTFTIVANSGVSILNINPASPGICNGESTTLTATGGNGIYSWSPATGLSATSGAQVTASPTTNTTYTVTTTTGLSCPLTKDITVTVTPLPATPTASVTVQPGCTAITGTIVVTAPTGTFEYSLNNSVYQASTTFAGLTPGNYQIKARNTGGTCVSATTTLTVNAVPPALAAPTASVTAQPTCATPTGTITITAPTGANVEYSINGTTYQAGISFSGLSPANYTVTARNTGTGCVSAATTLTINAVPMIPAAPTASVTAQPGCSLSTGTITITAPTGGNFTYSADGTNYQAGLVFANLSPASYNLIVRNTTTGCVSAPTLLTVNNVPGAPAAPTASVTTQPGCTTTTGSITITAPVGIDIEYSINGTAYQQGTVFNGLAPGNYNVTARNTGVGCISAATQLTINLPPQAPAAPIAVVTVQPDCILTTGTITINMPVSTGLEYSINGTTYQAGLVFSNLAPAGFNVTTRNTVTGCVSAATVLTVNPLPQSPAAPTASVTAQPTCSVSTGTIVITAPVGGNFEYGINGTTFQVGTGFPNVTPGNYIITVRNTSTGCTSAPTPLTVNAVPQAPTAPTASVTAQPTCNLPTGTITITAPTGTGLEYSIDGTTYQAGAGFAGLAPATYSVLARNAVSGCVSTAVAVTVNAAPGAPQVPVASVTVQPTCTITGGTIVVATPVGIGFEYSTNGALFQSGRTFTGLIPGNYTITVRNTNTGCTSAGTPLTINAAPTLQAPGYVATGPTCIVATGSFTITSPTGSAFSYSIDNINFQVSPTFNNLAVQPVTTEYSVVAKDNLAGCISTPAIIPFVFNPGAPPVPVVNLTAPGCAVATGTATVITPVAPILEYSLVGGSYQTNPFFGGLNAGTTYQMVSKYLGVGCPSLPVSFTIPPGQSCGDVYFPSAFSPNGDGKNEGFGPVGDLTVITNYSLHVFNRYGQLVFKTNTPSEKWYGLFRGKLTYNANYVWQAHYIYRGRFQRKEHGNITIIK